VGLAAYDSQVVAHKECDVLRRRRLGWAALSPDLRHMTSPFCFLLNVTPDLTFSTSSKALFKFTLKTKKFSRFSVTSNLVAHA
jgi:hypothetical protein